MMSIAPTYKLSRTRHFIEHHERQQRGEQRFGQLNACTWDGLRYSMALVVQKNPNMVGNAASANNAAITSADSSPITKPSAAAGIRRYSPPKTAAAG